VDTIQQLQDKRRALSNTARAVIDRALNEGRALRPSEELDIEGISFKAQAISRTLQIAHSFNLATVEEAQEPRAAGGGRFIEAVRALHVGRGNQSAAVAYANSQNPDLARALSAGFATSGGYAIPQGWSGEIIAVLRARVAVRRLGPIIVPMDSGNLTYPKLSAGSTVQYIGENAQVVQVQPSLGSVNLLARKLAALVPISNTLMRSANPSADKIVTEDLTAAAVVVEDAAFIRGDGTAFTPRGLRNWALRANVFNSSGSSFAQIDADLSTMEAALTLAGVPMLRPGWILSTRTEQSLKSLRSSDGHRIYPEMTEAGGGKLRGFPYVATTSMPTNLNGGSQSEIILSDFSQVIVGEYPLLIDPATAASYKDSGGNTVQAFSVDQTVIRLILQSDLVVKHAEAVAVLAAVTY
jgi:HK97 family phage major capsid protein